MGKTLKETLEAIWEDGKLRSPFGPVWWHHRAHIHGGYSVPDQEDLFWRPGKWTPNPRRLRRRRKVKTNDLLKK